MLQFASVSIQGVIPLSRGVFSLLSQDSGSSSAPGKENRLPGCLVAGELPGSAAILGKPKMSPKWGRL